MSFNVGNYVVHKSKFEWGLGKITHVYDQQKVKVIFNNSTEKIIGNADNFLRILSNKVCILCLNDCMNEEVLSNGWIYHGSCYEAELSHMEKIRAISDNNNHIFSIINDIVRENETLKVQFVTTERTIQKINNPIYKLINAVFGKVTVENETIKLKNIKNKIESNIAKIDGLKMEIKDLCGSDLLNLLSNPKLTMLYDYWLSRPPDWDARRDSLLMLNPACEACDSPSNLHIHHIIPISKGGSHREDNLMVLCEECHSSQHGGKEFTYKERVSKSSFVKKLDVIKDAIRNEQDIQFVYKKYGGETTNRKIKPIELKKFNNLCVRGYCYMRNDERSFAIKKMSKVKICVPE